MNQYFSLDIELASRDAAWLAVRLRELGFDAWEERSGRGGACFVIYDRDASRLHEVRQRLRTLASRQHVRPPQFVLREAPRGWEVAWTEHLSPVWITPELCVVPHEPRGAPLPHELYLEPAFAFGFAEHASTRLLARYLARACRLWPGRSVLDVGTGTGVLALVAKRMGASRVVGTDTSEHALRAARANAALNGVVDVAFCEPAALGPHECFDIVAANIESAVLLQLAESLVARVVPGGELVLSGFIAAQCEQLAARYEALGMRLEAPDADAAEGDWRLLAARRG